LDNTKKARSKVDMKTIISDNWKITTPIVANQAEIGKYRKEGYSVLRLMTITKEVERQKADAHPNDASDPGTYTKTYTHKYLQLFLFQKGKDDKIEEKLVGSIAIGDNLRMTDGLYKTYLQIFNNFIAQGEKCYQYRRFTDKAIAALQSETLLVPDYVLDEFDRVEEITAKKAIDPKKLLKQYKFKYEVLPQDQIDARIAGGKNTYYVIYLRSELEKYIMVANGKTGEILFSYYAPMSANLKPKDLGKISNAVQSGEAPAEDAAEKDE
jgi:hypothetical protein